MTHCICNNCACLYTRTSHYSPIVHFMMPVQLPCPIAMPTDAWVHCQCPQICAYTHSSPPLPPCSPFLFLTGLMICAWPKLYQFALLCMILADGQPHNLLMDNPTTPLFRALGPIRLEGGVIDVCFVSVCAGPAADLHTRHCMPCCELVYWSPALCFYTGELVYPDSG